jgi:hypothetical protein
MLQNNNRDDIANKLSIVNKIIRKGYEHAYDNISSSYKDYCQSIKHNNYFQLREQLMSELSPLVHSNF